MNELRIVARCVLLLTGALACAGALAQAAPAAEPSASSAAAADRAQKQADRTLYWIRVLAEKPAPKPATPAAPKPAAAPAPRAVAAEPRPAPKVASAATPAAAEVPSPAPAPLAAVVAAPPAAVAPAVPGAGRAAPGVGIDAAPAMAAGIAAPTLTPPEVELPQAELEEPDPGLIMVKSADPQFPMATMRRLRKGEVEVKFEVGPDGQVDVVSVVRSTSPSLNTYALDAVRQWLFKPTPHGHTAVVDLAFNLDS